MRRRFIAITCWIVTKRSKVVLIGVHSQPGAKPWVDDGMPSPTLYNVSSDLHTSVSFSSSISVCHANAKRLKSCPTEAPRSHLYLTLLLC